jgi:hypothetical protein
MSEINFKPLVIVGNWKSGTTLLQFLLAKDKNIHNIFPYGEFTHQDGTQFWRRYKITGLSCKINGFHVLPIEYHKIPRGKIIRELNGLHNNKCEFGLLKRPEFSIQMGLLEYLFGDVKFIGIKRNIYANCHSMMRIMKRNDYPDNQYTGILIPGFLEDTKKLPPLGRFVKQYCFVDNTLKNKGVYTITFEDLCDNTEKVIKDISKEINYDISIEIPDLINPNAWKEGGELESLNPITVHKTLTIEKPKEKKFPPLSEQQINDIDMYYEEFKDIKGV